MEQKQLDELEDSFFGEEFIEDLEDLPPATPTKNQEIKIEPREQSPELRLQKMQKKTAPSPVKKTMSKKTEKSAAIKLKEPLLKEKPVSAEKKEEEKEQQLKDKEMAPKKETVTI